MVKHTQSTTELYTNFRYTPLKCNDQHKNLMFKFFGSHSPPFRWYHSLCSRTLVVSCIHLICHAPLTHEERLCDRLRTKSRLRTLRAGKLNFGTSRSAFDRALILHNHSIVIRFGSFLVSSLDSYMNKYIPS